MNIYITLDYELFFGTQSGSVDNCIIKPTQALLDIVEPYNIKFTCFVDSGYLLALEKQKDNYPELQSDYKKVTNQIKYLSDNGHGIELHIHPHWEDSFYNGEKWVFNTRRYRLANFNETEVLDIVTRYNNALKRITGKSPIAYRAGGWSAQPFLPIKKALQANNVQIDSTSFANGYHESANQVYDFRGLSPYKTKYKIDENLAEESINGDFTEIPISSYKVSPFFFWKFAFRKIFKQDKHKAFGNGSAIAMPRSEKIRLLTTSSYSVVSVDGYKASLIAKAYKKYKKHTSNSDNFVLIGHPKAFTPYSLQKVKQFIENEHKSNTFVVY